MNIRIEGTKSQVQNTEPILVEKLNNEFFNLFSKSKDIKTDDMKKLIEKGVQINARDIEGWTPLMYSVVLEKTEIVKFLIENGADVNARNHDFITVLMYAAIIGNKDIAKLLIENGAEVNAKDTDGWTARMHAEAREQTGILDLLKEK